MRTWRVITAAVLSSTLLGAVPTCQPNKPSPPSTPSEASPRPASTQPATTQPTTQPAGPLVEAPVDPPSKPPPPEWLKIGRLKEPAVTPWATGRVDAKENKVEIQIEGAKSFSIDLGKLGVDWRRRVVLRINGDSAELVRGDSSIKHFELTSAGRWVAVRPGNK